MRDPARRAQAWPHTLAQAWRLARPFWRGRERRAGLIELGAVVLLTLGTVALNVMFSNWNNRFYDALQRRDLSAFWQGVVQFAAIASAFIVAAVYRQFLQQKLQMRWRTEMTREIGAAWLQPAVAATLARAGAARIDNPDQRIANDIDGFVASTLDLSLGLLNASVTLVSFIGILWVLSGALAIPWSGGRTLLGYMVWVALIYSAGGSWLAQRIGRPLTALSVQRQRTEADFRYQLVQVRDHAEAIALARGERAEQHRLRDSFDAVRANWTSLIRATKRLTWFSVGFGQTASLFPLLAAAPRYFARAIQLGGLMQTAQVFGQVQGSMSWFVDAYGSLASWQATVMRLATFVDAVQAHADPAGLPRQQGSGCSVEALEVATPAGRTLIEIDRLTLDSGERLLVEGPSGSGKSSLLRMLAGLWPARRGWILMPAAEDACFVPQRPYLPADTLAAVLAYPRPAADFAPQRFGQALRLAGLGELAAELGHSEAWSRRLSPGEQQRVQFARLFLQRPGWIFLDEATSALDEAAQREMYETLFRELPGAAVLSVGHRGALRQLHGRRVAVRGGRLIQGVPEAGEAALRPGLGGAPP